MNRLYLLLILSSLTLASPWSQAADPNFANSRITVGPSFAFLGLSNFSFGLGPTLSYIYRKDAGSRFHFGVETGYLHWSDAPSFSGDSTTVTPATSVPVLLTVYYHFKPAARIKPYIAIGAGIAPTWMNNEMSFYSDFLLKPGLEFRFFYIESKVGLINMNFVLIPTFGIYLDLL